MKKFPEKVWRTCLFTISLVSLIFLVSCATVDKGLMTISNTISSPDPVTGQRQINLMSENKEIQQATNYTKQLLEEANKKSLRVDEETNCHTKVLSVFDRLKQVIHRKHLPWEIHTVEDESFNAFTVGGGKIFVHTGLFNSTYGVQSDDELAAILAHEIAHVTARHATERSGKVLAAQLADKNLKNDKFNASFTTIQEDEADRYSVIYSSLAGYDPEAGMHIWQRIHEKRGSFTNNMLYDHPLSDDRAYNLRKYASLAKQYYTPDKLNPDYEKILKKNKVFSYAKYFGPSPGEGGGVLALLETAINTFSEVQKARTEAHKRNIKQIEQEREASRHLTFKELQIAEAKGGGKGLFGYVVNLTNEGLINVVATLDYISSNKIILSENVSLNEIKPFETKRIGVVLKSIYYSHIQIRPVYVQVK